MITGRLILLLGDYAIILQLGTFQLAMCKQQKALKTISLRLRQRKKGKMAKSCIIFDIKSKCAAICV